MKNVGLGKNKKSDLIIKEYLSLFIKLQKNYKSDDMDNSFLPDVFHFDEGKESFEDFGQTNGGVFWLASDLINLLGYESESSFNKAVNKAMTACNTLNIPIVENFEQIKIGANVDWKLSRFACYLITMNADPKKSNVAKAQAYFATIAGAINNYLIEAKKVERIVVREEISDREKSLAGVAHQAGVVNYPFFQNAGYRGMYNLTIGQLRERRGIEKKRSPLDFMGKDELAANLFRVTQTELKIKQERITGQPKLEATAETVGREVRVAMRRISGIPPENLPIAQDIIEVKKELKETRKKLKKIDNSK
jgi:DNA-damage-inducible protein D